jgi:hypothetical protein
MMGIVLKAIREKCLDCCGDSRKEVSECPCEKCSLHPFRFGKNPYRKKREMSEEQRINSAERLALAREKKEKK